MLLHRMHSYGYSDQMCAGCGLITDSDQVSDLIPWGCPGPDLPGNRHHLYVIGPVGDRPARVECHDCGVVITIDTAYEDIDWMCARPESP